MTWPRPASSTWRWPRASTRRASTCMATTRRRPSSTTRSSAAWATWWWTRSTRSAGSRAPGQRVLIRVTPGIKPSTHSFIQTGQVDSKFGFPLAEVPERGWSAAAPPGSSCAGCTPTSARRSSSSRPSRRWPRCSRAMGDCPLLNLGGGLGIAYTAEERRPRWRTTRRRCSPRRPTGCACSASPAARSWANAGVTVYTVGTVKGSPASARTWRWTAGCPTTCGRCSTTPATRPRSRTASGAATPCTVAGMHCESGDMLVRDVELDDPRPGDVLVIPATGAYGHAMANNYNAVRRPPVIFCRGGDARVVVRRETFDDLTLRDRLTARSGSALLGHGTVGLGLRGAARGACGRRSRPRPAAGPS